MLAIAMAMTTFAFLAFATSMTTSSAVTSNLLLGPSIVAWMLALVARCFCNTSSTELLTLGGNESAVRVRTLATKFGSAGNTLPASFDAKALVFLRSMAAALCSNFWRLSSSFFFAASFFSSVAF